MLSSAHRPLKGHDVVKQVTLVWSLLLSNCIYVHEWPKIFLDSTRQNTLLVVVTSRKHYLRINAELILKLEAHMRYRN